MTREELAEKARSIAVNDDRYQYADFALAVLEEERGKRSERIEQLEAYERLFLAFHDILEKSIAMPENEPQTTILTEVLLDWVKKAKDAQREVARLIAISAAEEASREP